MLIVCTLSISESFFVNLNREERVTFFLPLNLYRFRNIEGIVIFGADFCHSANNSTLVFSCWCWS